MVALSNHSVVMHSLLHSFIHPARPGVPAIGNSITLIFLALCYLFCYAIGWLLY